MAISKTAPIALLYRPSSSRQVPAEERQAFRLDDASLNSHLHEAIFWVRHRQIGYRRRCSKISGSRQEAQVMQKARAE